MADWSQYIKLNNPYQNSIKPNSSLTLLPAYVQTPDNKQAYIGLDDKRNIVDFHVE